MIKPITSRVQSATQKGERIIEPLLNVGAAGVKGGSATRRRPSPLKGIDDVGYSLQWETYPLNAPIHCHYFYPKDTR